MENNRGLKTKLWGTPPLTDDHRENSPLVHREDFLKFCKLQALTRGLGREPYQKLSGSQSK